MNDVIRIVKSLEESELLIRDVNETIENEAIEQKWAFLSLLLSSLGTSALRNTLIGKGTFRVSEETIRTSQEFWCRFTP